MTLRELQSLLVTAARLARSDSGLSRAQARLDAEYARLFIGGARCSDVEREQLYRAVELVINTVEQVDGYVRHDEAPPPALPLTADAEMEAAYRAGVRIGRMPVEVWNWRLKRR